MRWSRGNQLPNQNRTAFQWKTIKTHQKIELKKEGHNNEQQESPDIRINGLVKILCSLCQPL